MKILIIKLDKIMWSKKIKFSLGGLIVLGACFLVVHNGYASNLSEYTLEVPIGGTDKVTGIADYIDQVYQFLIGAAGLVAAIMIMFGGWNWIFAAGNDSTITSAKETITSAIVGLVLALASYLILFTINPALVELVVLTPNQINPADACASNETGTIAISQACTKNCQCSVINGQELEVNGEKQTVDIEAQCIVVGNSNSRVCAIPEGGLCAWQHVGVAESSADPGTYISRIGKSENKASSCATNYLCGMKNQFWTEFKDSTGNPRSYLLTWRCYKTNDQYDEGGDGMGVVSPNYCTYSSYFKNSGCEPDLNAYLNDYVID